MKKTRKILPSVIVAALFLILFCAQAYAGLVIERVYSRGTAPGKSKTRKVVSYFQGNKVKTIEENGNYSIVDLATGTMTMVNPKKKEYSVTSLDSMVKQMQRGMDKLKAHLKGLSPEQRAMMEKMMGISQGPSSKLVLKKLGDRKRIAGYEATHYVITKNGKKVGEYWVSKALREKMLKEMDREKIEKFEKAMNNISNQLNVFGNSNLTQLMEMEQKLQKEGEIVKQIHYPNNINMNKQGSTQEVVSVKEERIPAAAFEVPKGYKKTRLNSEG